MASEAAQEMHNARSIVTRARSTHQQHNPEQSHASSLHPSQCEVFSGGLGGNDTNTQFTQAVSKVLSSSKVTRILLEKALRLRCVHRIGEGHVSRARIDDLQNALSEDMAKSGATIFELLFFVLAHHPELQVDTILTMSLKRIIQGIQSDGIQVQLDWSKVPQSIGAGPEPKLRDNLSLLESFSEIYGPGEYRTLLKLLGVGHLESHGPNTNEVEMIEQDETGIMQELEVQRGLGGNNDILSTLNLLRSEQKSTESKLERMFQQQQLTSERIAEGLKLDFGHLREDIQHEVGEVKSRVTALEEQVEILNVNSNAENEALSKRLDAWQYHSSQIARDSCRFMIVGAEMVTLFSTRGEAGVRAKLAEWEAAYRQNNDGLSLADQIKYAPVWVARFAPNERLLVQMWDKRSRDEMVLRCRKSPARPKRPADPYVIPCLTYYQRQAKALLRQWLPEVEQFQIGTAGDWAEVRKINSAGAAYRIPLDLPEAALREAVDKARAALSLPPPPPRA